MPPISDHARDLTVARCFLAMSARRIRRALADLWDNDDQQITAAAKAVLL